jgi:hypothetical protein
MLCMNSVYKNNLCFVVIIYLLHSCVIYHVVYASKLWEYNTIKYGCNCS